MLYLNSGLPGHGKTLFTIDFVEKLRLKSQKEALDKGNPDLERFVYYHNIADLALPWARLFDDKKLRVLGRTPEYKDPADPAQFAVTDWEKLPKNSIIVLDECQDIFPPRPAGSHTPDFIQQLAKHRHLGLDFFLVTQQPSFIDSFVRRLVDEHRHIVRAHLPKRSNIFRFLGCKENVHQSRAGYVETQNYRWPSEVFKWYKSTVLNTHKPRIPKAMYFLFAAPFLLAALGYYLYSGVRGFGGGAPENESPDSFAVAAAGMSGNAQPAPQSTPKPLTSAELLDTMKDRFYGLSWSQPRYDELTKPKRVPVYRGCIVFGSSDKAKARCVYDGGHWVDVPLTYAQDFIKNNGYFIDFEESPDKPQSSASADSSHTAQTGG